MCGLTGYVDFSNSISNHQKVIKAMMALQEHRGPDDNGIAIINTGKKEIKSFEVNDPIAGDAGNIVFGFNRLSILDLSRNGHQPMIDETSHVVMMMNGEIYNAFDLKPSLEKNGYKFRSTTDTEVVLALYLEVGFEKMLDQLNGMFALVIFDLRINKLFLARDRFGIKPLYVLKENGRIAFSSEMKSFGALPGFHFELDETNINEFLLFRNLINRTLFKKIVNIEPGEYWVIDLEQDIKVVKFYDVNKEAALEEGRVLEEGLENTLKNAVKRQMIADVKVGCQLSGGVDSSLVTLYASGFLKRGKLETISIIPTEKHFSEEVYMDEVINTLKLLAHKYSLDFNYYFDNIEKVCWHFEQPLNHPNTIGIYQLSQNARKHVTVLLSGEGADEILAGYSRFEHVFQNRLTARPFLGKIYQNKNSIFELFPEFLNSDVRLIMASTFTSLDALKKLKPDFNLSNALTFRKSIFHDLQGDKLLKQRKYEIKTYLPDLLMRQDKMSMAHSIENRVPFLDNEMVKTSLSIHSSDLMGNERPIGKYMLKKIAANHFPSSFAFRKKQGFPIPLRQFFKSDLFQERWNDEWLPKARERGIFRTSSLGNWMGNLDETRSSELDLIWLSIGFELWAKQYLD